MSSVAKKLVQKSDVFQELGRVVRAGGALRVRTDSGEFDAKRAVSCLVEPEEGDLVLLASTAKSCHVLAVLEREGSAPTRLVAEGDLTIQAPRGRFAIAAQEGIDLASGKDVSVVSGGVSVNAVTGSVVLQRLSLLSTFVQAEIEKAKLFAGSLDSVLDRISQRVKRSYRTG